MAFQKLEPIQAPDNPEEIAYYLEQLQDQIAEYSNLLEQSILENFTFASSAGMMATPPASFPDITTTPSKIDIFDTIDLTPSNEAIELDVINSTFMFHAKGRFQVNIMLGISHNELNAGRDLTLYLYNQTDDALLGAITYGTGRNVGTSFITASYIHLITESEKDGIYSLYIEGSATYSTVVFDTCALEIASVGTFDGALG